MRLIERADQIFALRVVDADFAADRAVHLRQQRCRHMHEGDAAQVGGRGEAGHVADDAAAEGDERRRAVGLRDDERVVDARDGLEVLVALAVRHEYRLGGGSARAVQRLRELWSVQPPDQRARDDEAPLRRVNIVERARKTLEGAVGNGDGVGARRRRDVEADGLHESALVG